MTREPGTEAGRRLWEKSAALWFQPNPLAGANAMRSASIEVKNAIPAIEAEARAAVLAELRAGVEGLGYPLWLPRSEYPTWQKHAHPSSVDRVAVLRLIADAEEHRE